MQIEAKVQTEKEVQQVEESVIVSTRKKRQEVRAVRSKKVEKLKKEQEYH